MAHAYTTHFTFACNSVSHFPHAGGIKRSRKTEHQKLGNGKFDARRKAHRIEKRRCCQKHGRRNRGSATDTHARQSAQFVAPVSAFHRHPAACREDFFSWAHVDEQTRPQPQAHMSTTARRIQDLRTTSRPGQHAKKTRTACRPSKKCRAKGTLQKMLQTNARIKHAIA